MRYADLHRVDADLLDGEHARLVVGDFESRPVRAPATAAQGAAAGCRGTRRAFFGWLLVVGCMAALAAVSVPHVRDSVLTWLRACIR